MLFSRFEALLQCHIGSSPRPILLALSGGIDSRVMLALFAQFRDCHPQHDYAVVHVHHGLSDNADAWMRQCQTWVDALNIPFHGVKVQLALKRKSIEQAAREARYQAIENVMKPNALVLTAQHADDQVETVLLALKRGSGLAGLAAMPEIRPFGCGNLLRPFLHVERREIEAFAQEHQLDWLEDESNQDSRFDRNFIRHHWLPIAQERWPNLNDSVRQTALRCADDLALLDELLEPYDAQVQLSDGCFCLTAMKILPSKVQMAVLRRWLKRMTGQSYGFVTCDEIVQTVIEARDDANPRFKLHGGELRRSKLKLSFVPQTQDLTGVQISLSLAQWSSLPDGLGELGLFECSAASMHRGLIRPTIKDKPVVRFDPTGLSAHPVGRQGKRKLKKLFQEYEIPSWQRRRIPLIFYGETLVAVGDLFICEGFQGSDYTLVWKR